MLDSIPVPLPNLEVVSTMPCPTVTLEEVEGFYRELHTPTGGRMVVKQLLNKLLVYVGKEVDHRGDCLMLMEMGISLAIPPGKSLPAPLSLLPSYGHLSPHVVPGDRPFACINADLFWMLTVELKMQGVINS